jgi:hypothetical protein
MGAVREPRWEQLTETTVSRSSGATAVSAFGYATRRRCLQLFNSFRVGALSGKQLKRHPALAAVTGATPKPTRVLVIFSFYFYTLACFHLDRVPVLSFIFPLNACLCVRFVILTILIHSTSE